MHHDIVRLEKTMSESATAMMLAMFAADSLALGVHWIYDTDRIDRQFGRVDRFLKPSGDSYHKTKDVGEFTHYGDQALCLLGSLAENKGFGLEHFAESWRALFKNYSGYYDKATRATLSNFDSGRGPTASGSGSSDLGGASRMGPLVYCLRNDEEMLAASAREQTGMTHNNADVIESAAFFGRLAIRVLNGISPSSAIQGLKNERLLTERFSDWIDRGAESAKRDTRQAISDFGQDCSTPAAFPSVIHLIVKYENNLKESLIENVMAGGDSAARGMLVGMVLGAYLGMEAIPEIWLSALKARERIMGYLSAIDR